MGEKPSTLATAGPPMLAPNSRAPLATAHLRVIPSSSLLSCDNGFRLLYATPSCSSCLEDLPPASLVKNKLGRLKHVHGWMATARSQICRLRGDHRFGGLGI